MVGTLVLAAATLLAAWFGLELPGVHSIAWPLVSLPGLLLAVAAIPSGLVGLNELREVRKAREDLQRPAT